MQLFLRPLAGTLEEIEKVIPDLKPLHVKVAEKLGCVLEFVPRHNEWCCSCSGREHQALPYSFGEQSFDRRVKAYHTDWAASGPVMARLGIGFECRGVKLEDPKQQVWYAWRWHVDDWTTLDPMRPRAAATTPLLAVCLLILALPDEQLA